MLTAPDKPWYWTPLRRELLQWLEDRTPSFVEGYKGAVELLHSPEFPGRVHFICHAVRDIYRLLPNSLGTPPQPRPSEIFPNMVKKLTRLWSEHPLSTVNASVEVSTVFTVSAQVYRYVEQIIQKSRDIGTQPTIGKQLAIALFRSLETRNNSFIPPWLIASFDAEYDFFVKRAHLAQRVDKVPNDDGLKDHFEAFERAFHSLVGPYFSGKNELDAILQDTNAAAD